MEITENLRNNVQFYFLIALLVLFGGITFLLLWRYLAYILVAAFMAFLTYPIFVKVNEKVSNKDLASLIVIVGIIFVVVIPLMAVSGMLVNEASNFVRNTRLDSSQILEQMESSWKGIVQGNTEIKDAIVRSVASLSGALQRNLVNLVSAVADFFIGIFLMLFLMYYFYKQGPDAVEKLKSVMPMESKYRDKLFKKIDASIKGVFIGHLFTALIQGAFGALGLFIFGVSRPILWGFVMMIISVVPLLGPFVIYIPFGASFFLSGEALLGLLFLIYGFGFVGIVDNLVRPYLTSMYIEIHPAIVLVSVIGGMASMGAIGIFLGPLFFAIFVALIRTYRETVSEMMA